MSAIKRFFSSHKTSSNSKVNHPQNHENSTSQNKSSVIEKLPVTNEQEEVKENTSPLAELPLKYSIEIEFEISLYCFNIQIRDCAIAFTRNG
jgi:hypothetical protein